MQSEIANVFISIKTPHLCSVCAAKHSEYREYALTLCSNRECSMVISQPNLWCSTCAKRQSLCERCNRVILNENFVTFSVPLKHVVSSLTVKYVWIGTNGEANISAFVIDSEDGTFDTPKEMYDKHITQISLQPIYE
jgi:hypothetical protein